jgi:membrane associated rhomboid family serine protease
MFGNYFKRLHSGDPLLQLILINGILFIAVQVYLVSYYLSGKPLDPIWGEDLMLAANSSLEIMKQRPWSLATHMFAHIHTGHFLFNMIALYSMGKIFLSIERPSNLWKLYLLGGTFGYFLFAISFHFSDVLSGGRDHAILGASAAVMAIVVATAVMQPRRIVYLFGAVRLELAWLAIILIVLDLASIRQGVNSGGHIGHIGGGLFGFFYGLKLFEAGKLRTLLGSWKKNMISLIRPNSMKVVHRRPKTDDEYNAERVAKQKKIDIILDKISQSGYESLTQTEKDFLFKHSQK